MDKYVMYVNMQKKKKQMLLLAKNKHDNDVKKMRKKIKLKYDTIRKPDNMYALTDLKSERLFEENNALQELQEIYNNVIMQINDYFDIQINKIM